MLPPKLEHILGCVAFSEFIFAKNIPYAGKSLFQNTMKLIWLTFFLMIKTLRKYLFIINIGLYEKTAFGFDFRSRKVPLPENA